MSTIYLLSLFACTIITTYASEQQALALPDWSVAYKTLCDDYRCYLTNQLEHYKTSHVDMETLKNMAHVIKHTDPGNDIFFMKDDQHNGFIHLAIEKEDVAAAQWLYRYGKWSVVVACNNAGKNALDLCIEKLSPDAPISPAIRTLTLITFNQMANAPGQLGVALKTREKSLKSLITLQLDYQKQQKKLDGINFDSFCINIASALADRTQQTASQLLSLRYRQATDEAGNTFTHLFVEQGLPDELFKWIKQDRVSFAKNKAQLTPLDVALSRFRYCTTFGHHHMLGSPFATDRRCCLFMLLNYLKMKEGSTDTAFGNCCDKHIIAQ